MVITGFDILHWLEFKH